MAISLNDNIQTLANKPSDFRYGPWTGVTQVNSNIPNAQRYLGLTVGILNGGVIHDYWYYSGITNSDLILKTGVERWTFDFMDAQSIIIYADDNFSINQIQNIVNSPTITITVNNSTYTLGNPISLADEIEISSDIQSVVKLEIVK